MQSRILNEFRAILGEAGVITGPAQLRTYECDGLTNYRVVPEAVLLPTTTGQVQSVVHVCHRERIGFAARGPGTGLSGGAPPVKGGVELLDASIRGGEALAQRARRPHWQRALNPLHLLA